MSFRDPLFFRRVAPKTFFHERIKIVETMELMAANEPIMS